MFSEIRLGLILTGAFVACQATLFAWEKEVFTQTPEIMASTENKDAPPPATAKNKNANEFAVGTNPFWIWGANTNTKYTLTKDFAWTGGKAKVKFACDNIVKLKINGVDVGGSSEWQTPVEKDVTKLLKDGNNSIEALVENEGAAAGFVFKMVMTSADGKLSYVISDDSWKAVEAGKAGKASAIKKVAKLGDSPWGNVLTGEGVGASASNSSFKVPEGFQVEKLFTVPKDKLGSWVCLTVDPKGRIIASDQGDKGLYRITVPAPGVAGDVKVEKLDVKMSAAQGLLYAFGSLYVSVNGGQGSGLYRLRDTNNDDQFDEVVKLKALSGGGEHGPHALRLSPDGKSILIVCGNHTLPPENFKASRLPRNWSEDHLLPRQWDANGHARGILAPGGYVAKTDPDGKDWEIISSGYRNEYDFALNADGEMFVYDADMEWDMGMPWYRPTRVNHAPSGSELGWRSGTGKWPAHYVDSLPAMVDIGPGSPVGVEFGYGTKFPAKYQKALYICDWTFGTMYAIHISPMGSSYKATKEEFVSRTPLPLTDVVAGKDGALYFSVGGRGAQSELFRVTYVGKESTAPAELQDKEGAKDREIRKKLEAFHNPTKVSADQLQFILSHLGNEDRFIRYAARVALEHQDSKTWQDKVLSEKSPEPLIQGIVALARQADKSLQTQALKALDTLEFSSLSENQKLEIIRAYQLVFIRMGEPAKEVSAKLSAKLDSFFPSNDERLNRDLGDLLVYLKSSTIAAKITQLLMQPSKPVDGKEMEELLLRNRGYGGGIAKMYSNFPDLQKNYYLYSLRNLKENWNIDQRKMYFTALNDARTRSGGASYQGFLNNIEKEAFDNATDNERLAIEALGLKKPYKAPALPKATGPGKEYKLAELVQLADGKMVKRDFKNGQKMYAASRCVVCHRYNGDGGATGPDLSQVAGRFSLKDLCESIVEPNKVISDQYKASIIETKSGKFITGKVVSENAESLIVVTDPEDSSKVQDLKKKDVESVKVSPVSLMPQDLLKTLNENEVLDLLAYLLSRGDPSHTMFKK
ncbi:MAG: c-type cytochrome [Planctomycetota bacterium]|nr:c-type cytochrome [Planctomycetota bacterium]